MGFLAWLTEHLTPSRKRPELHQAMQTADELRETKRVLTHIAQKMEQGDPPRIVYIRNNVLEQAFLKNRLDQKEGES